MAEAIKSPRRAVKFPSATVGSSFHVELPSKDFSALGTSGVSSPRKDSSAKAIGAQSPRAAKELEKKYKGLNYFELANSLCSQLPTKQNIYRLKTYPNTLLGNDIIKWLLSSNHASTLVEAEFLGAELIGHGHIYNVLDEDKTEFDSAQLYKFARNDRIEFSIDLIDLNQVESFLARSIKKKEMAMHGVTHRDVFCGYDAVELIIIKGFVIGRTDAAKLCNKLLFNKSITMVHTRDGKNEFFDDVHSFYKLRDQNRQTSKITFATPLDLEDDDGPNSKRFEVAGIGGYEDGEARSVRSLLGALSPKTKGAFSLTSPLHKMASKGGLLSPRDRALSRQVAHSSRSSRTDSVSVDVVEEEYLDEFEGDSETDKKEDKEEEDSAGDCEIKDRELKSKGSPRQLNPP